MEFVAAKCPNCGGDLRLPDDKKQVKCMYCGFDIIVREAIVAAGANVENWLKLSSVAEATGNHAEAYKYFTQVLEFEPNNYTAQLGKGINAGYLSTPYKFRSEELVKGVEAAIENAPEDKKQEIKLQAADKIHSFCSNFDLELDDDSDEFKLARKGLVACLNLAHDYSPQDENIIMELHFHHNLLAINSKRLNLTYQTNNFDEFVKEHNRKAEEYLFKLESVNPEKAASLRKSEKASQANSGSGCLVTLTVFILSSVISLILLF